MQTSGNKRLRCGTAFINTPDCELCPAQPGEDLAVGKRDMEEAIEKSVEKKPGHQGENAGQQPALARLHFEIKEYDQRHAIAEPEEPDGEEVADDPGKDVESAPARERG